MSESYQHAVRPNKQGRPFLANLVGFLLFPALTLILIIGVVIIAVLSFENRYQDRIYPGIVIWDTDLGGMTVTKAKTALAGAFEYPNELAFTFRDPGTGKTWKATPAQLGVILDLDATVEAAFRLGREDTEWNNLLTQIDVFRWGRHFPPVLVYDRNATIAFLETMALEIYQPVVDAGLVFAEDQLIATPSQVGRQMNMADAYNRLSHPLGTFKGATIDLEIDETQPQISDQQVALVLVEAEKITKRPITVYLETPAFESDPGPRTLGREELADLLILWLDESQSPPRYMVRLDKERISAWLEPLVDLLQTESEDARFVFDDETGQLEPIQDSVPARSLDVEATVERIVTQAQSDNRKVPLVVEWTKPTINEDATGEELGITELVVVGESSFAGSSDVRVHNIATAASRFHGIVIKPGEEFSFNEFLGDVSEETGFEEGLIIFGGRTIKGVGGGVCQVSTTAFRAAFFAGFPIRERWPHGYRVGYYEQGTGPGMDATVFYPEVDFRFVNDSPYHLLIETYTYERGRFLEFKFYSTGDGRTVEVGETEIDNVIEHPPDRYEENPDLELGEVKQVDWAADGADVVIGRVVKAADGSVMLEDEFKSHYLPWQAVFEYGPGTEGMPPPETDTEADVMPSDSIESIEETPEQEETSTP